MAAKRKRRKVNKKRGKRTGLIAFFGFFVVVTIFVIAISNISPEKEDAHDRHARVIQQMTEDFEKCYYFEKKNLRRYISYKQLNPVLAPDAVVWQVNVGLDHDPYDETSVEKADLSEGNLLLVSKRYRLDKNYRPKGLAKLPNGLLAKKEAVKAYKELSKAAEKEGFEIYPVSAYRSYKKQQQIYGEYRQEDSQMADDYSARPGYSEHQTGLAIDINNVTSDGLTEFKDTPAGKWLAKNAHKFGFIIRYTKENKKFTGYMPEAWHVRYLGKKHASVIYEKKIKSFEEYKVKYLDHKKGKKEKK